MIGSSYQSSLSPRSTTWISDWPTNFLQSKALTRAHSVPERTTHVFRSEALIRAHWLPDWPTNLLWSGALIRAHWHPDRQDDQGSLTPWLSKNFLRSGALTRAHWLPWSTKNNCFDRELLSELIVTPINKSIKSLIYRQNCRLLGRQTNFSRSGALIRAYWHPINQKRLAIRSSYQSSLTPWSTNKHVMIGSSYQSSLTPRSTRWSGLIDPLIDQKLLAIRSSYQSSLIPWSSNKLLVIGGSYQSLFPPWLIRVYLRSGAGIRAQWLKNWSTTLFRSGALARAHWLFVEQQERLQTHSYW